ncbi:polysaccharide biosynthesis/export family protein [uncultured Cocleimonas sp.]|uniref:polysaccharide biosynthesis/export family protein n=1 Tax=uncultured Cocleimonas sp. TaxID=1051587 RepID=UPI002603CDA3|nr:polysaccharide biosynthesis/export family protein [uncultured Cocleimonas sp.]
MKKLCRALLTFTAVISLVGCSFSPGVPGLSSKTSRYEKAQKEGVDYKLVVIDRKMIQSQKPFNYENYINNKKKRYQSYVSDAEKTSKPISRSHRVNHTTSVNTKGAVNFAGVSANDVKSNYQYYIGDRDILSITVWDHPELTIPAGDSPATHDVGNDGKFYFPYAGKIQATGKTVEDVRKDLEKKLQTFIAKPQVSVRVASFRSQKVYISGAVQKPITLPISDTPLTVRDLISRSGGVISRKYTGQASLQRRSDTISIDLNRMLKFNDNRQNFILRNGDRLHVVEIDELDEWKKELDQAINKELILNPIRLQFELEKEKAIARQKKDLERELKSEQAKVFVMGEINKPGTVRYQIEDGMTLAEAINDAGSLNEDTVNPKGIFVIRQESSKDSIPTVYQLPVASVHSMLLAEQFDIRPRDIVYVTATPSIRWNRVLALLLPSLTILNTFENLTK